MKKSIIALVFLALSSASGNAQTKQRHKSRPVSTNPTTTQQHTTNVDKVNNQNAENASDIRSNGQTGRASEDPYRNSNSKGITAPDHAYEPAGTERAGFFGNGTGGSTIGSTESHDKGTGVTNTNRDAVDNDKELKSKKIR